MDAEKVARITGHRFEGYSPGMLAIEVELFQSGQGAGSMSEAVEALKAVATALSDTDEALRDGLQQVGVSWQSGAAEQAKGIFGGNADFAGDAKSKVNNAAQAAFVLSEAYTGMVNKLPDPQTLRNGDGGMNLGDVLGGLIGHETDNAAQVRAARAARDQTVDAITEFQQTCGDELSAMETLDSPQHLQLDDATDYGPRPDPGGSIATSAASHSVGLSPEGPASPADASRGSTAAAGSGPSGGWTNEGRGTVGPGTVPDCPPEDRQASTRRSGGGAPSGPAPTPEAPSSSTSPSSAPSGAGPVVGGVGVLPPVRGGGASPGGTPGTPGTPGGAAPGTPGATPGTGPGASTPGGAVVPPVAGAASGAAGSPAGQGSAGVAAGGPASGGPGGSGGPGKAGFGGKFGGFDAGPRGLGGLVGGPPEAVDPLAKGKMTGAAPLPPAGTVPPAPLAAASTTAAAGTSATANLAGGAAALAAGGVAGAAAAEEDKQRRAQGLGKDTDVDGKHLYDFEVGERPDEQDAANVEKLEPPAEGDQPKYLEQAAVQPGVTDETRVRSHGVDDVDLFADQRMVAPEVIGDDPASAYRANRADDR